MAEKPLTERLQVKHGRRLAYPKLSSKLARYLSRDTIHAAVETWGWSAVSQIAIDTDWSALRLKPHAPA
jgi:hypothetical protein